MTEYADAQFGMRYTVPSLQDFGNGTLKIRYRPPTDEELARYEYFEKIAQYVHVESGAVFEGEAYWVRVE